LAYFINVSKERVKAIIKPGIPSKKPALKIYPFIKVKAGLNSILKRLDFLPFFWYSIAPSVVYLFQVVM
jgi:hypothetical protein